MRKILFVAIFLSSCAAKQEENEKSQLIAIIKKNAQDPTDLEIVEWGEKKAIPEKSVKEVGGHFFRRVNVRCKLIDYEPRTKNPINRDYADITYDQNGFIKTVNLERCARFIEP